MTIAQILVIVGWLGSYAAVGGWLFMKMYEEDQKQQRRVV